jgi:hypothetical protein
MADALSFTLIDPAQARMALTAQLVPYCRQKWAAGVDRLRVTVEPEEDAKTVQQGKFYWGVVLKEISEQARIAGVKYAPEAWHELFKRQFLPRKKKVVRVAGSRRPVVSTTIGTTQGIGVRKMSAFIEKCLAFGVTDLGVRFSSTRWEEYR